MLSRGLRAHLLAELGRDDLPLRVRPFWGDDESPLAWEAETNDADLLVVGTNRGRSSTAVATVRGSRVPVLCIPARPAPARKPALAPIRTVLVTTDFSTRGDAAIPEAYRLLARGGGEVVLAERRRGQPDRRSRTAGPDRDGAARARPAARRQPGDPHPHVRDRRPVRGRGDRQGDPALQSRRRGDGVSRALRYRPGHPRLGDRARRAPIAQAAAGRPRARGLRDSFSLSRKRERVGVRASRSRATCARQRANDAAMRPTR